MQSSVRFQASVARKQPDFKCVNQYRKKINKCILFELLSFKYTCMC